MEYNTNGAENLLNGIEKDFGDMLDTVVEKVFLQKPIRRFFDILLIYLMRVEFIRNLTSGKSIKCSLLPKHIK